MCLLNLASVWVLVDWMSSRVSALFQRLEFQSIYIYFRVIFVDFHAIKMRQISVNRWCLLALINNTTFTFDARIYLRSSNYVCLRGYFSLRLRITRFYSLWVNVSEKIEALLKQFEVEKLKVSLLFKVGISMNILFDMLAFDH